MLLQGIVLLNRKAIQQLIERIRQEERCKAKADKDGETRGQWEVLGEDHEKQGLQQLFEVHEGSCI